MRKFLALSFLSLTLVTSLAGMPQLRTARVSWPPIYIPPGYSNVVVVVYKSISLGTVFTPYKPTCYIPATRTNGTFAVLSGTLYHFYLTTQYQPGELGAPFGESSPPSNICTNLVN